MIVALLIAVGRATLTEFNRSLVTTGLRARQVAVLRELAAEPVAQQALSDVLRMDPTKLVGLLNELEESGLVRRRRDSSDRRRHIVQITDAGAARLTETILAVTTFEDRIVAHLPAEQRTALRQALESIREALDVDTTCDSAVEDDPSHPES